ncbi:regulator of chromosome condensation 1/beta-lactamase-inhibitor protein II [Mortierella sp. GBAus27b]|nr:regulator of chromosome condensation 1/beta-lactamase-inhibitor protein II [Mortierella sp. GBAus27b]
MATTSTNLARISQGEDKDKDKDKDRLQISILDLPFEILVGEILAQLRLADVAQMARVCRKMHQLCVSEYLWQRKFCQDFFPVGQNGPLHLQRLALVQPSPLPSPQQSQPHSRTNTSSPPLTQTQPTGWRRIYQAMDRVEVYTWGSNTDCRLGYGRTSRRLYESVPKRVRRLDGVGIVQLAPTGWGCHALDKHGNVWAWGRIMETSAVQADAMPRMLTRPQNVVQLAAGRQVVLAKDDHGRIWQWSQENHVVQVTLATDRHDDRDDHIYDSMDNGAKIGQETWTKTRARTRTRTKESGKDKDPVDQITAGWDICAALTRSGRLFAWRQTGLLLSSSDGQHQQHGPHHHQQPHSHHRIHVQHSVTLKDQGSEGYEAAMIDGDKFVQIAAGSDFIIAVTLLGRVYIFRRLDSPHYQDPITSTATMTDNSPPWQLQQDRKQMGRIVTETVDSSIRQERIVEIQNKILGNGLYLPIFSEALARTITATYEEYDQWERRLRHNQRTLYPRSSPCQEGDPSDDQPDGAHQRHGHGYRCADDTRSPGTDSWSTRPTRPHSLLPSPPPPPLSWPPSRPTIVSASGENFALHHSSGKVLLGKYDVQVDTCPTVLERLHSNACQVVFGDHHQGLLTEDGQLRTWGSFCYGALGHGDLRNGCAIPTVVDGPLKNKIVIAIGMAGWHSACLAIDMNEGRSYHGTYQCDHGHGHVTSKMDTRAADMDNDRNGKVLMDDGYFSFGSTTCSSGSRNSDSCSSNSDSRSSESASSSEGFESSDGEEQESGQGLDQEHEHKQGQETPQSPSIPALLPSPSSSPSASPSSGPVSTASSWTSRSTLYPSRLPRPSPLLRKRSSSMSEIHSHCQHYPNGYRNHVNNSNNLDDYKMRMLSLTRLNPILTVYKPEASPSSAEVEAMTRRFSVM